MLMKEWIDSLARKLLNDKRYFRFHKRLSRWSKPGTRNPIRTPHAAHRLLYRTHSSDIPTFRQIYLDREYRCLDHLSQVGLIIDCGANVGYSSAYFLSRFPTAHAIAIEPDAGNFKMLQTNLAPYGDRVRLIHGGIWSHTGQLAIEPNKYADGLEWSRQVREIKQAEPNSFPAFDVGTLLAESGADRISILKIDIEGAEGKIFAENYESWISKVDNLVIEIHDNTHFGNCSSIFHAAIRDQNFSISQCDELTVCRRAA